MGGSILLVKTHSILAALPYSIHHIPKRGSVAEEDCMVFFII